jgi:diketogulonate reductase-like aldo/keto reductase
MHQENDEAVIAAFAGGGPRATLRTGVTIPQLGLATFRTRPGAETRAAVAAALTAGYRHVDTARAFRNEEDVGAALRESEVARSDVFVTTKLLNLDQGYDATLRAFDQSVRMLGVEVLDAYLLHWPVPERRLPSWRALERCYEEKRVRAIGVSNFLVRHLEELLAHAHVPPALNQLEVTPFLQRRDVRALCAREGIVVECLSPLGGGRRYAHPVVVDVARACQRTPAQILLRWAVQSGLVVLPHAKSRVGVEEHRAVFDFSLDRVAMERLDALEEGDATEWNPDVVP